MNRHEALVMARRGVLRMGGGLVVAGVGNQLLGVAEGLLPESSVINVVGRDRLSRATTSAVVGVPGQFLRSAADPLIALPILKEKLGVRLDARLGNPRIGLSDLERGLVGKQKETRGNLRTLSWYCLSDGFETAAQLIPRLGDQFATNYVFLDCSPTGLADAKGFVGDFARLYKNIDTGANPLVTALSDSQVFHNRNFSPDPTERLVQSFLDPYIFDDIASSPLAEDQYKTLAHSAPIIRNFAKYVTHYNEPPKKSMKIVFLLPINPDTDTFVDDIGALKTLSKIIPGIIIAPVGGNQGHANPVQNPDGYTQALNLVFAQYGV